MILENNLISTVIQSCEYIKDLVNCKNKEKSKRVLKDEDIDASILKNYERMFREKKIKQNLQKVS